MKREFRAVTWEERLVKNGDAIRVEFLNNHGIIYRPEHGVKEGVLNLQVLRLAHRLGPQDSRPRDNMNCRREFRRQLEPRAREKAVNIDEEDADQAQQTEVKCLGFQEVDGKREREVLRGDDSQTNNIENRSEDDNHSQLLNELL